MCAAPEDAAPDPLAHVGRARGHPRPGWVSGGIRPASDGRVLAAPDRTFIRGNRSALLHFVEQDLSS